MRWGSPPEVLEQVLLGAVDMSLSGQDQIAKHLPFYDTISTPFAFKDYATADKIIDGPFKEWADPQLATKGLVHLSDWEWGFRQPHQFAPAGQHPGRYEGLQDPHAAGLRLSGVR